MPKMNPLGAIFDIVESFPAIDLHTGTNTGDWIDLKNMYGALLVFLGGVGAAGDVTTITFQQAKTAAGGSAKALAPSNIASHNIWKKEAATNLTAVGSWSDASAGISAGVYSPGAGNLDRIAAIWIDAAELDVNNGFCFVQATVLQAATSAMPGACIWIPMVDYPNSPANVLSPIV